MAVKKNRKVLESVRLVKNNNNLYFETLISIVILTNVS